MIRFKASQQILVGLVLNCVGSESVYAILGLILMARYSNLLIKWTYFYLFNGIAAVLRVLKL